MIPDELCSEAGQGNPPWVVPCPLPAVLPWQHLGVLSFGSAISSRLGSEEAAETGEEDGAAVENERREASSREGGRERSAPRDT